jgi:hypothetical protein
MPITLNHSNIGVQYNTGSNYIIETVKSDLYLRNEIVDTIVRDNIQAAPVIPVVSIQEGSNIYAVESYIYSGSANTTDYTRVFTKNTVCDILIVAGGGGGGQQNAGGGGAGGLVLIQNFQANGTYTINVGKGGNGGISQSRGSIGNNSKFTKSDNSVIITANGGGGGGSTGISGQGDGLLATNGGSGGGGGYYLANGTQTQKSQSQIGIISPAILNQFGEDGGHGGGSGSSYPGGGGGGAGGVGATSASNTTGQNGGLGIDRVGAFVFSEKFLSSIGDNGWFAGGGGSGGDGASDGYGNGGSTLFGGGGNGDGIGRGINGISGTGGGGGGTRDPSAIVGNGGSGIVIIRYLVGTIPSTNFLTTEPTVISPVMTESIRTFVHSGGTEEQTSYTITVGQNTICDVLVVGGGGSGGRSGGGGGAVIYTQNVLFPTGTYSIKVGNGGISNKTGSAFTLGLGNDGKSSDIVYNSTTIFSAIGGGGGGLNDNVAGRTGGSSGGGENSSAAVSNANIISTNTLSSSFTTLTNQSPNGSTIRGNIGGKGFVTSAANYMGGGGGGAGGAGGNGNNSTSGAGGTGINNNITGSDIMYGSGGSAGVFNQVFGSSLVVAGSVSSGGGTGAYNTNSSGAGVAAGATIAGRGGGGGGLTVSGSVQFYASDGGSGIVIIKFKSTTAILEGNPITHKTLNFAYTPTTPLVYDFTPYNDLTSWKNYATSIGATTTNLEFFTFTGVFGGGGVVGSIQLPLPSGYNMLKVNYNNPWTEPIYLYIDNVVKQTCPPNSSREYIQSYTTGQVLKIEEVLSVIGENLIITLTNTNYITNTYTLNFPVPTIADINNNSNIVLRGAYDISLSTMNSSIIPKSGQYIPKLLPLTTSNISIRYNLLNPLLDSIGAQWTYNSSNTNVYHMGNVGIGTKSPEYNLDVRGSIYSSLGGYTQTGLTTWSIASDRRIKENIVKASYEKCLDNVKNIELYNFNFKDDCVNTNDKHQLGFIAQEVQQVYPKAVEVNKMILNTNETIDDLLSLNTTQIDYTLYGAVKNLIEKIEDIDNELGNIERNI